MKLTELSIMHRPFIRNLTLCLMISLMTACASSVSTTAEVIGAAAGSLNAYWNFSDRGIVNVIAPECLWFIDLDMQDPSILNLSRENKIRILSNSENNEENCRTNSE